MHTDNQIIRQQSEAIAKLQAEMEGLGSIVVLLLGNMPNAHAALRDSLDKNLFDAYPISDRVIGVIEEACRAVTCSSRG